MVNSRAAAENRPDKSRATCHVRAYKHTQNKQASETRQGCVKGTEKPTAGAPHDHSWINVSKNIK